MAFRHLTPAELKQRLQSGERTVVLDVREHDEIALCRIEGSVHVPMGEISRRARELDASAPTVCVCHHGVRSARVAAALVRLGFQQVYNLRGGIDRWAAEVDPQMTRY